MFDPGVLVVENYFLRVIDLDNKPSYQFMYASYLLQGGQVQRAHNIIIYLVEEFIIGDHLILPELVFALSLMIKDSLSKTAEMLLSKAKLILDLRHFKLKYFP
mmetsp:Transcript_13462/g.20780  ORF Transcript_13462/g.20780 Transcript_13462/m.20780 type:complete len:103 (-) Transcript_13462:49-357(-)